MVFALDGGHPSERAASLQALSRYGDVFELACLAAAAGNARRFSCAAASALAWLDKASAATLRQDSMLIDVKAVHHQTVDLAHRVLDEHTTGLPPGRALRGLHELEARQFTLLNLLRKRYGSFWPR
jgi:hypothetical protein